MSGLSCEYWTKQMPKQKQNGKKFKLTEKDLIEENRIRIKKILKENNKNEEESKFINTLPLIKAINAINRKASYCLENDIEFDLDVSWYLYEIQNGCALSGIGFKLGTKVYEEVDGLYAPSIDRINGNLGYTKQNCRLILNCLNKMRGVGDDDVLIRICYAVVNKNMC